MTQIVAPSTSYEATLELGVSGLVGTLSLGTYDGDTATQALSTAAINEIGTSGVYIGTRTSPGTGGQYVLIWSQDGTLDPDQVITEDLLVTSDPTAPTFGTSNLYVTVDELKEILAMQGETYADLAIEIAVSAASRACDGYKRTRFYPTSEARVFTVSMGSRWLRIGDLSSLTSITIDADNDGVYETTWVQGTDFALDPVNASLEGIPWNTVSLLFRDGSAGYFPAYRDAVKVTGQFGWSETPALVKQATMLLANMILSATQGAPMGVVIAQATEAVALARLGRIHPTAAGLLDLIPGTQKPGLASIQLG